MPYLYSKCMFGYFEELLHHKNLLKNLPFSGRWGENLPKKTKQVKNPCITQMYFWGEEQNNPKTPKPVCALTDSMFVCLEIKV